MQKEAGIGGGCLWRVYFSKLETAVYKENIKEEYFSLSQVYFVHRRFMQSVALKVGLTA